MIISLNNSKKVALVKGSDTRMNTNNTDETKIILYATKLNTSPNHLALVRDTEVKDTLIDYELNDSLFLFVTVCSRLVSLTLATAQPNSQARSQAQTQGMFRMSRTKTIS